MKSIKDFDVQDDDPSGQSVDNLFRSCCFMNQQEKSLEVSGEI
jgi:hypothetical protein